MNERVDALLRDLQGAVSARNLYAADHPRVADSVHRVTAAAQVLTQDGEISVHAHDHRVVFRGTPLASSDALSRGLFGWLAARGFHRLTLQPGITPEELSAFVTALSEASRGGEAPSPLASSAHLRLSVMQAGDGAGTGVPGPDASIPEAGTTLGAVWRGVMERRTLEFDALDSTVLTLVRTVERNQGAMLPLAALRNHDDYTVVHIVNVAMLAIAFSEVLGFHGAVVRDVGVAALLHDVGKLRVPPDVLNAPGRLTEAQRALVRRHPEDGARLLMATPRVPALAVSVAFEHHLQFDGGGYPTVPKGWRTNLASEITHIADVFDALRSNRPYRQGLARDVVVQAMERDAGTVFSPGLLRVFFDAVVPHTPAGADATAVH